MDIKVLHLKPFREERERYSSSPSKTRNKAGYVTKQPYFFTIPEFSLNNTWRGSSEIIRKYYYQFEKNFSILDYASLVSDGNYILCVSWRLDGVVYRYKLWNNEDGILYVPMYDGRTIYKNFYLEIWTTDSELIAGGGTDIVISQFKIPTCLCDSGNVDLSPSFSTCSDMIFDLSRYKPNTDFYRVVNTCLGTELVEAPVLDVSTGSNVNNIQLDFIVIPELPVSEYEIWKSINDGDFELFDTIAGTEVLYQDTDGLATGKWSYKIKAKFTDGTESNFSEKVSVVKDYYVLGSGIIDASDIQIAFSDFGCDDNTSVTHLNLSGLKLVSGNLFLDNSSILVELKLDKLATVIQDFHIESSELLTDLQLPSLINVFGNFFSDSCTELETVFFNAFVPHNGMTINFDACALTEDTVNYILHQTLISEMTGSTLTLDAGTNAAPTGQGILDKANLITNGNTVSTN